MLLFDLAVPAEATVDIVARRGQTGSDATLEQRLLQRRSKQGTNSSLVTVEVEQVVVIIVVSGAAVIAAALPGTSIVASVSAGPTLIFPMFKPFW